jgi:hypothetical protein
MYLQVNPSKARSAEEKADQDKLYKPGENVLPKLRKKHRDRDRDEDQRVLDDVIRSSRDEALGISTQGSQDRRRSDRSGERRGSSGSTHAERQVGLLYMPEQPRHRGRASPRSSPVSSPVDTFPQRSIEHQSSIRSLLSVSESDIEEDIMRQIASDPSLTGIDWDNLSAAQSDELSERIARAYRRGREERRRQEQRDVGRISPRPRNVNRPANSPEPRTLRERHSRTRDTGHLSDNPETSPRSRVRQRPRSGSQPAQGTSRPVNAISTLPIRATNISTVVPVQPTQPTPAVARQPEPRPTESRRRTTDPSIGTARRQRQNQQAPAAPVESPQRLPVRSDSDNVTSVSSGRVRLSPRTQAATFPIESRNASSTQASSLLPSSVAHSTTTLGAAVERSREKTYPEPCITCQSCKRANIQYQIYYTCVKCDLSGYHLCQSCYRQGKGCKHWFGFGWAALAKFEKMISGGSYPPSHELPHILTSSRYIRPQASTSETKADESARIITTEDPAQRLQSGVFCDICDEFANHWYWQCGFCNEGEWGFCNRCVNQGKHCTHPLLSLEYKIDVHENKQNTSSPSTPTNQQKFAESNQSSPSNFQAKAFKTTCDICKYLISPSISRYHCPQCNGGDYDIHTECYVSLVKVGRIAPDNGHQGWRRCLNGHRMVILGFEDREGGKQVRIVDRDLVGGVALKEDDSEYNSRTPSPRIAPAGPLARAMAQSQNSQNPSPLWSWRDPDGTLRNARHHHHNSLHASSSTRSFPPDGGIGLRLVALWSYYPDSRVSDELLFPKGAEIREAEDINGDWFWGVYAGAKGLFPGNYARVIGRV